MAFFARYLKKLHSETGHKIIVGGTVCVLWLQGNCMIQNSFNKFSLNAAMCHLVLGAGDGGVNHVDLASAAQCLP